MLEDGLRRGLPCTPTSSPRSSMTTAPTVSVRHVRHVLSVGSVVSVAPSVSGMDRGHVPMMPGHHGPGSLRRRGE